MVANIEHAIDLLSNATLICLGHCQTIQWFNHTTQTNNGLKCKYDVFTGVIIKSLYCKLKIYKTLLNSYK